MGEEKVTKKPLSRKDKRKAQRIQGKFYDVLSKFYRKVGLKQLTEDEIRATFQECNSEWVKICINNNMDNKAAKSLFAHEIQTTWNKKIAKAKKIEEQSKDSE